jgi:hypothetical protein
MIYSLVFMVSCVVETLGCVGMSAHIVRSYDVVLVSPPKNLELRQCTFMVSDAPCSIIFVKTIHDCLLSRTALTV